MSRLILTSPRVPVVAHIEVYLDPDLSTVGRVLLVLNRGGFEVVRLTLESAPSGGRHPGLARLDLEVRADDGGARLARRLSRIVSVVEVRATGGA